MCTPWDCQKSAIWWEACSFTLFPLLHCGRPAQTERFPKIAKYSWAFPLTARPSDCSACWLFRCLLSMPCLVPPHWFWNTYSQNIVIIVSSFCVFLSSCAVFPTIQARYGPRVIPTSAQAFAFDSTATP